MVKVQSGLTNVKECPMCGKIYAEEWEACFDCEAPLIKKAFYKHELREAARIKKIVHDRKLLVGSKFADLCRILFLLLLFFFILPSVIMLFTNYQSARNDPYRSRADVMRNIPDYSYRQLLSFYKDSITGAARRVKRELGL